MKFASLMAASCILSSQATAQTGERLWTFSTSTSWSKIDETDRDAVSGSLSLSRLIGDASAGVSLATSNGSDALFDETEVTDRSSIFASTWVVIPVGSASLDLSLSYGQDDFDGRVVLESGRFEGLDGTEVDLLSEVDSISVAASISKVFIVENWDLIPNASVGWSQSDATTTAQAPGVAGTRRVLSEAQSGLTASTGLGVGYVANDRLYLFTDLAAQYAENGASVSAGQTSRMDGLRATARQEPGDAAWADISAGASFYATDALTFSLSGGKTVGRDDEEIFATASFSIGF